VMKAMEIVAGGMESRKTGDAGKGYEFESERWGTNGNNGQAILREGNHRCHLYRSPNLAWWDTCLPEPVETVPDCRHQGEHYLTRFFVVGEALSEHDS
jgi:hypothetical protein